MIELKRYDKVERFQEDVVPFLERWEGENNLALGVALQLKPEKPPLYMATVQKNNEIALVLLQTHPRQLIVSKGEPFASDEIETLAALLVRDYPQVPGLIGESSLTLALAEAMASRQNRRVSVRMRQGVYVLKQIQKPASKRGELREAAEGDAAWLYQWFREFCEDARVPSTMEEAVQTIDAAIANRQLYVWYVDGEPMSMARWARPTRRNVTIGIVYTPRAKRKQGYASDLVAALTQRLLDTGYEMVSLYTDLDNPTSNKIYMEIGYERVMDSVLISLEEENR